MHSPSDGPKQDDILQEPVRTGANQFPHWLTVKQAIHRADERGLKRTGKTFRIWARRSSRLPAGEGDVIVRRKDTPNGKFQWLFELASLDRKIDEELELNENRNHSSSDESVRTNSNKFEPVLSEKQRLSSEGTDENPDEPVRTGLHADAKLIKAQAEEIKFLRGELTHRRKTDEALQNVIAGIQTNAQAQLLQAENKRRELDLLGQGGNPASVEIQDVVE